MIYTELTEKAMKICFQAHKEQKDKGGIPYVFHPFHVAEQMDTETETCVALLHDVIEDTGWTLNQIAAEGFPSDVLNALELMTHDSGVQYLDYVQKLSVNPIAKKVKMADLKVFECPGYPDRRDSGSGDHGPAGQQAADGYGRKPGSP